MTRGMQAGRLVGQLAPGLPLLRDRLGADHIVRPVARRCTCALLRPERCRVVALAFGWRRCGIYLEVRRSCTSSAHLRHSAPLEIPHAAGRRGGRAGRRGNGCSQATDRSNGCFQVIPGSHLRGVVAHAPGTGAMAQVRHCAAAIHLHRAPCPCPSARHDATGVGMYGRRFAAYEDGARTAGRMGDR